MTDDHYVICHGGASGEFFLTRLPQPLEFEGDWEVGCVQATIPHSWKVTEGLQVFAEYANQGRMLHIKNATYSTIDQLVNYLNWKLGKSGRQPHLARFSLKGGYVKYVVTYGVTLTFSRKTADLLGFRDQKIRGMGRADYLPDMTGGQRYLYLSADCIRPSIVGNTERRVLATFPLVKFEQEMTRRYSNPKYLRLASRVLNSITLSAFREDGRLVRFESGRFSLTLHFRKCAT